MKVLRARSDKSEVLLGNAKLHMFRKMLAFTTLALAFTACGNRSSIEDAVKSSIVDPDSAKFGELVEFEPPYGGNAACIVVNTRDLNGEYTGNRINVLLKIGSNSGEVWKRIFIGEPAQGSDCNGYVRSIKADRD